MKGLTAETKAVKLQLGVRAVQMRDLCQETYPTNIYP